ncbi:hypothetical protein ACE1OA_34850 [Streptomyces sp. JL2001]|uniref:hypothetical protein n=1 Tax=Streptomyces sp. JL2001 TaxID=3342488 RepID=UPI003D801718
MTTTQQPKTDEGPFQLEKLEPVMSGGSVVQATGVEFTALPETLDSLGVSYPPPPTDPPAGDLYVWTKKTSFGNIVLNDPIGGNAALIRNMVVIARRVRRPLVTPRIDLTMDFTIQSINRRTLTPFGIDFEFKDQIEGQPGATIYPWYDNRADIRCGDVGRPVHASKRETSYMSWFPEYVWLSLSIYGVATVKCT